MTVDEILSVAKAKGRADVVRFLQDHSMQPDGPPELANFSTRVADAVLRDPKTLPDVLEAVGIDLED